MDLDRLPVAVIGAGPIGLAAAAHLHERRIPFVVLELGDDVAASVRDWAHVQLFSPWRHDVDPAARRLLDAHGWSPPPGDEHPTGGELISAYLEPLALLPGISVGLRTNRLVTGVTRAGADRLSGRRRDRAPFVVATDGPHGVERTLARAVIDASGTWLSPNPLGADGLPAVGERRFADVVEAGMPDVLGRDRRRYAGRRVAVVGSGHSAQHAVRDLALLSDRAAGTEVTWIVRRPVAARVPAGADDVLPERGRLRADAHRLADAGAVRLVTGFRTERLDAVGDGVALVAADGRRAGPFDRIVNATGFRPDLGPLSELRIDVDPALQSARALAPMVDPEVHTCGTVPAHGATELAHPEPGFWIVGAKSYGRAPTFLLATGHEQVRSVVATIAGDHASGAPRSPDGPRCAVG